MNSSAIIGSLLGTAVGDALGLPYEKLSPQRGRRLLGEPGRHRFIGSRGMISDDTEHTCLVAQALIASGRDVDAFSRSFARGLRLWLLGMPAGLGRASLLASLKLCAGVPPSRSGVRSAGNGPAMRSALLGVAIDDTETLARFVRAATRLTHIDPRAAAGALVVALAAHQASRDPLCGGQNFLERLPLLLSDEPAGIELLRLLEQTAASAAAGQSTPEFAASLGLGRGVSGYIYHTVPVAIHAWLRHPRDYRSAVLGVLQCGGDTDTTAAIVGGIVGAAVGKTGIPSEWLNGLLEWPRTVGWMERLGDQLHQAWAGNVPQTPLRLPVYGLLPRNLFFLAVVLAHGGRRLLPPY